MIPMRTGKLRSALASGSIAGEGVRPAQSTKLAIPHFSRLGDN